MLPFTILGAAVQKQVHFLNWNAIVIIKNDAVRLILQDLLYSFPQMIFSSGLSSSRRPFLLLNKMDKHVILAMHFVSIFTIMFSLPVEVLAALCRLLPSIWKSLEWTLSVTFSAKRSHTTFEVLSRVPHMILPSSQQPLVYSVTQTLPDLVV